MMGWSLTHTASGMAILAAFLLGTAATPQEPEDAARPHKSVYGKLLTVDRSQSTLIMESDTGDKLSWRFERNVIAEAAAFQPGEAVIVIYRLLPGGVKRVTALAFPGQEKAPTYVNMTGVRVVLRSAPRVDGACDAAGAGPVSESVIPSGGRAEVLEECWCCAAPGETCRPTTKAGLGRAFLVQCFK
jgi:hypothetical protein